MTLYISKKGKDDNTADGSNDRLLRLKTKATNIL